jgi:hypothetical protein
MKIRIGLKAGFETSSRMVPAGPIWSDDDASSACHAACAQEGMCADGRWITIVPGKESSCSCIY